MFFWPTNKRKLLNNRKKLARWGEKRCGQFLVKKGFTVLARNFLCKMGELDLVMADSEGTVIFVEVKTRSDESFAAAESSITSWKQRKLARAAKSFLRKHNIEDRPCRFDVVTILLPKTGKEEIRHYENAFVPS